MSSTSRPKQGRADSQAKEVHNWERGNPLPWFPGQKWTDIAINRQSRSPLNVPSTQGKEASEVIPWIGNSYRNFVPNFTEQAVPFTEATWAGAQTTVIWMPEAESEFQEVKEAHCQSFLLYTPYFNKAFMVQADASNTATGTVLVQRDGNEEHPLVYTNRKLHPYKNYATIDKECLAIKWAVEKLSGTICWDQCSL